MGRKEVVLRAARSHPFIVVMLCFLAFLYGSFPNLFSLLVFAFPIIFCTGILIGALLSFSQQNAPKIKGEEKIIHRAVQLKTSAEISQNVSVLGRVDRYSVQRLVNNETSQDYSVEGSSEEVSSDDNTSLEDDRDGRLSDIGKAKFELLNKERGDGLILKDHCLRIPKPSPENLEFENDKSIDSSDSKRVNIGSPCLGSRGKHQEEDDDDDYDDEIADTSSSSSSSPPDSVSVADSEPMLDELHPLLDEDVPHQPANLYQQDGNSDASSEHSSTSNDSVTESDDDESFEEQTDELQVDDNDGDDEEIQGEKDGLAKRAIKWTEEDQKNVMEVGSSELERNQLLERVMERRKSRKCVSMMGGKELITFECLTPQNSFNFAPIVTARQNPFDLLPDLYEEGLPPVPGSAPSVLIPKRNPFDIPYNEEKADLPGHNSQLNFLDFQPNKDAFLHPRAFSNLRPSVFVAEQMVPEGTSYSTVYTQLNGLSDSKASSGPKTESMGSVEDLEDKNVIKEDIEEKRDEGEMEEKKPIDEHNFGKPVLISKIEHVLEHVGHGSESSEEEDEPLELSTCGKKNIVVDEIVLERKLSNKGLVSNLNDFHLQQNYSSVSNSTTSSEEIERIFVEKEDKPSVGERKYVDVTENVNSRQPSMDGSELSMSSNLAEEGPRRDPVYDSSPPRLKKNLSFSSIASDILNESWFLPAHVKQVKRTVSFAEGVIMMERKEMLIPTPKELLESSTISSKPVNVDES